MNGLKTWPVQRFWQAGPLSQNMERVEQETYLLWITLQQRRTLTGWLRYINIGSPHWTRSHSLPLVRRRVKRRLPAWYCVLLRTTVHCGCCSFNTWGLMAWKLFWVFFWTFWCCSHVDTNKTLWWPWCFASTNFNKEIFSCSTPNSHFLHFHVPLLKLL